MSLSHFLTEYTLLLRSKVFKAVIIISILFIVLTSFTNSSQILPLFMKSRAMYVFIIISYNISIMVIYLIIISRSLITKATYTNHNTNTHITNLNYRVYYIRKFIVMISIMLFLMITNCLVYLIISSFSNNTTTDFTYDSYLLKLIIFFSISSIHYIAYVSIITMFSFFKGIYGILLFIGYVFLEGVLKVSLTNQNINIFSASIRKLPRNFLLRSEEYIITDRIISSDYILSVIPSIIIIFFTILIGQAVLAKNMNIRMKSKYKQIIIILMLIPIYIITSFFNYEKYKSNRLNTFSGYEAIYRNYNWYVDQRYTGLNAATNCLPSCGAMILKWVDEELDYLNNVNELKYEITPNYPNEYWEIDYLISALDKYGINNFYLRNVSIDMMKDMLDRGNILLLNLRFTAEESGEFDIYHTIIIKGYETRPDSTTYFHVYDPGNYWPNNVLLGFPDLVVLADELMELMAPISYSVKNYMYVIGR